jgi:REP element-mobilizing transposase RayT
MSRPLRIQYPGAFYHITNRGNERKPIFKDNGDRKQFLKILSQSVNNYRVVLHGFVLMSNHYHLLAETPLGNLAEFMRHFNISYTSHFNRRHHRVGHLFQGRYKSVLVEQDVYFSTVAMYIHLNPVKVGSMKSRSIEDQMGHLGCYNWSSLYGVIFPDKREDFVEYKMMLDSFGGDNPKGRKNYLLHIEKALLHGMSIKENVVGQSVLGSEEFITWVQEKFLDSSKDRERPAIGKLTSYLEESRILKLIATKAGCSLSDLIKKRGALRWLTMDLL